jgi:hypothetical protein
MKCNDWFVGDPMPSTANCLGVNDLLGGLLAVAAVPWALSALYGYANVSEQENNDALVPIPGQGVSAVATPMAPPGMTLTCEQRRDAILAAARAEARDEMHAVTLRDLPQCDVP